jgi:hypothetical protein
MKMKKRVKKELKKILKRKFFRDSLLSLAEKQRNNIDKCDSCHRSSCAC